jgi:hypothetical protein
MNVQGHSALYFLKLTLGMVSCCISLAVYSPSYAQASNNKPIVYPSKGQTAAVQQKDTAACNAWAQDQTGFDTTAALRAQQENAADAQNRAQALQDKRATVGGEAIAGAAGGAITGVAIGAIAGNAGRGAAIGATAGAFNGRARNRAKHRQLLAAEANARSVQAQQQAVDNQKFADFQKAVAACMEGRGYVVK